MIACALGAENDSYERDFVFFESKLPELQESHVGKSIVVFEGEIRAVCESLDEALAQITKQGLPQAHTFVGYVRDPRLALIL